ncbi:toxin [Bacillus thuringiensis serovar medellin]|uniref:Toxin n=1 Tax=Bacillus thuringiensis subsp. medellin TaxID=79672 RepID=A0A9X6R861_BACTV|nr:RICIN domain-containing protein [Bacillus thuringiensis]OUB82181.1 toxin [Bacillus thuringiensis serovar medellin]
MKQLDLIQNPWKKLKTNARVIVLSTNALDNTQTLDVTQIEDITHLEQAIMLSNNFQAALIPTSLDFGRDTLRFDVEQGFNIANHLFPRAVDVNFISRTLSQNNNSINTMINMVLTELRLLLGISLANSVLQQLIAVITETFTNLNVQKESAWIFWGRETAQQTNYTYNILFAIQNAQTGNFMRAIPIGFEISTYAIRERVLFFTVRDYASYNVKIQAINVMQPLIKSNYVNLSGIYKIITALNNRSVITMSTTNGYVNLLDDNDNINQKWIFEFNHNQFAYIIRNLSNQFLVLTWTGSTANNIFATNYQGNDGQFWVIQGVDDDYVYLANMRDTRYVLQIENSTNYNGANVIVGTKTGGSNQRFLIKRVNRQIQNGIYNIKTALNNRSAITMSTTSNNLGDYPISLWDNNNDINQQWIFEFEANKSTYQIKNVNHPNLLLSWPLATFSNGIYVTSRSRENEHFWFLQSAGSGTFYLVNMRDTRYVLQVESSSATNGTHFIMNQRTGNSNQKFLIDNIN